MRHGEAEGLGGLEVDHQLKYGRLLDRQIGGLGTLQDLPGVNSGLAIVGREARFKASIKVDGKQWFRKVGTRAAQAISKIVVGAVRGPTTAIAFGSVAATVVRVPRTEAALNAGAPIGEAASILKQEIKPIDDVRSTADYRMRVAMNLLERFWSETA